MVKFPLCCLGNQGDTLDVPWESDNTEDLVAGGKSSVDKNFSAARIFDNRIWVWVRNEGRLHERGISKQMRGFPAGKSRQRCGKRSGCFLGPGSSLI